MILTDEYNKFNLIWLESGPYVENCCKKREVNESYIRVREYPDYMTNWGDTMIMLYLTYSTILAIWLFSRTETTNSFSRASQFKWYYYPAQILFQVASNHAFLITILYFVLLGGGDLTDHLNVHAHVMNSKLFILSTTFMLSPSTLKASPTLMDQNNLIF